MAEIENQTITGVQFDEETLHGQSWEGCTFKQCSMQGIKHAKARFVDCKFIGCDLANLDVTASQFTDVSFQGCKMLGIRWSEATPLLFSVKFVDCNLSFSDFFGMKLKKLEMVRCQLHGANFESTDLTDADLRECDFRDAIFQQTTLTKANLIDAKNYNIDPLNNKVKGARFSFPEAASLLSALGIKIS